MMETADTRLTDAEKGLLANLIGTRFLEFRSNELEPATGNASWGTVIIVTSDGTIAIANEEIAIPYFGDIEDVATISIRSGADGDMSHVSASGRAIVYKVERVIDDVLVYEDSEILSEKGADTYRFSTTKAIEFRLDGTRLVFVGNWVMELISIYRGPAAQRNIPAVGDDIDEADRDHIRAERTVVSLKEWAASRGA